VGLERIVVLDFGRVAPLEDDLGGGLAFGQVSALVDLRLSADEVAGPGQLRGSVADGVLGLQNRGQGFVGHLQIDAMRPRGILLRAITPWIIPGSWTSKA
jgi:hypothetical protein